MFFLHWLAVSIFSSDHKSSPFTCGLPFWQILFCCCICLSLVWQWGGFRLLSFQLKGLLNLPLSITAIFASRDLPDLGIARSHLKEEVSFLIEDRGSTNLCSVYSKPIFKGQRNFRWDVTFPVSSWPWNLLLSFSFLPSSLGRIFYWYKMRIGTIFVHPPLPSCVLGLALVFVSLPGKAS